MSRWMLLYPLMCSFINLILGITLHYFNRICVFNYNSMGFAYPNPTVWALRFPYIFFLLAVIGGGILSLSLINKISEKHLFGFCFGILAVDVGLLFVSALGYSLPFLVFPVVIE